MADRPVAAVVGEWVPRLVPGTVGAATHGLIRTAHAPARRSARPTRRRAGSRWRPGWPTGPRRTRNCPDHLSLIGHAGRRRRRLADLPYLPEEAPRRVPDQSTGWRMWPTSPTSSSRRWRRWAATAMPSTCSTRWPWAGRGPICATPTTGTPSRCCTRSRRRWRSSWSCPGWPREDRDAALAYAWQAVAAIHVAYDIERTALPEGTMATPATDELIERAVASGDEHAIKLTEAALRSHARSGMPSSCWRPRRRCRLAVVS